MRNINTMVSYSLRSFVALHICLVGLLFLIDKPSNPPSSSVLVLTAGLVFIVFTLLIADWVTRKDQARRFSKLIDSVIAVSWLVGIGAIVLYSLGMGMP